MATPGVSVVMPAYNEAGYLETAVRDVTDELRAWQRPFELHVVENGSTDGTLALAHSLRSAFPELRVHSLPLPDYGEGLRTGLLASSGDVAVTFDVDNYDVAFLKQALVMLTSDAADAPAIVIGSKRGPGARDARPWPRRIVTAVFSMILRVGFRLGVSDTHGMKAMRREPLDPLVRRCRFGSDLFDTELVIRAERAGFGVVELPVAVEERRPSRTPIWRRVPRTLVGLVRLRLTLWREARR
jgi:glycosyltransferase involved in cell wall biosynthesis